MSCTGRATTEQLTVQNSFWTCRSDLHFPDLTTRQEFGVNTPDKMFSAPPAYFALLSGQEAVFNLLASHGARLDGVDKQKTSLLRALLSLLQFFVIVGRLSQWQRRSLGDESYLTKAPESAGLSERHAAASSTVGQSSLERL